jgi:hypothetical protein
VLRTEPLLLAEDDDETVRGLVTTIVLRGLLVAADTVFDLSHLAAVRHCMMSLLQKTDVSVNPFCSASVLCRRRESFVDLS